MRDFRVRLLWFLWGAFMLLPGSAGAWWEATLQQVDIELVLSPTGVADLTYNLRYHVDRGRFGGPTLKPPANAQLTWQSSLSYLEDAQRTRRPVFFENRARDGAVLVRTHRGAEVEPGWVTVHLALQQDLRGCCLTRGADGRPRLDWTAFTWDFGMDRMTLSLRLASPPPGALRLETYGDGDDSLDERPLADGLYFERIRPVRWYEMRAAVVLPSPWLQTELTAVEPLTSATSGGAAHRSADPPVPLSPNRLSPHSTAGLFWLLLTVGLCGLLLALKNWLVAEGYPGRPQASPMLLLPNLPPTLRWGAVMLALAGGGWLQGHSFLAAGTLPVAAGVLLSLRGSQKLKPRASVPHWRPLEDEEVAHLEQFRVGRRARWAQRTDGTSLQGAPWTVGALALGWGWVSLVHQQLGTPASTCVALDLGLTWCAFFLTGRRHDAIPLVFPAAASLLGGVAKRLEKNVLAGGATGQLCAGAATPTAPPETLRLSLNPPPSGTRSVEVDVEPRLGWQGWSLDLVARIHPLEGEVTVLRARRARPLVRRLRRHLAAHQGPPNGVRCVTSESGLLPKG